MLTMIFIPLDKKKCQIITVQGSLGHHWKNCYRCAVQWDNGSYCNFGKTKACLLIARKAQTLYLWSSCWQWQLPKTQIGPINFFKSLLQSVLFWARSLGSIGSAADPNKTFHPFKNSICRRDILVKEKNPPYQFIFVTILKRFFSIRSN